MVAATMEDMGESGEGVMYTFALARIEHVILNATSTLNLAMYASWHWTENTESLAFGENDTCASNHSNYLVVNSCAFNGVLDWSMLKKYVNSATPQKSNIDT